MERPEVKEEQCKAKEGFHILKENVCNDSICKREQLKEEIRNSLEKEKRERREYISSVIETADIYKKGREYEKALEKYEEAKELKIEAGIQDIELSDINGTIAEIQILQNNIEGARKSVKEAKENLEVIYKEILTHIDKIRLIGVEEADKRYEIIKKIFELSSLHLGLEMTEPEFKKLFLQRVQNGVDAYIEDDEVVGVTLVDTIFMKYFDKVMYDVSHREPSFLEEIEGYEKIEKKLEKKNITEKDKEEIIEKLEDISKKELLKMIIENRKYIGENTKNIGENKEQHKITIKRVSKVETSTNVDISQSREIIRNNEKLNTYEGFLVYEKQVKTSPLPLKIGQWKEK